MAGALSAEQRETARKGVAFLFQRLASVGQANVADALGISEPTLSRFKNDDLERACQLIAACGGKIVPTESRCYRAADIEPLLQLAKARMEQLQSVEQLTWDETQ